MQIKQVLISSLLTHSHNGDLIHPNSERRPFRIIVSWLVSECECKKKTIYKQGMPKSGQYVMITYSNIGNSFALTSPHTFPVSLGLLLRTAIHPYSPSRNNNICRMPTFSLLVLPFKIKRRTAIFLNVYKLIPPISYTSFMVIAIYLLK